MHFIVLKSFSFFINRYKILHDPKEWITINDGSGSVQTSKTLDREVIMPKNELYNITVLAIDQGKTRVFIWDVTEELENKLQLFLGRITPVLCVCLCAQSYPTLGTLWTVAGQAPLSVGFSRQEYWSGLPFPSPGDLPDPGIEPESLVSPALAGGFFTSAPPGKPIFLC